jgi:hypothetical protein
MLARFDSIRHIVMLVVATVHSGRIESAAAMTPGTYIVLAMAIYREVTVMSNNEPSCELDLTTRSQRSTQISGLSETVTKRETRFDLYSRFTEKRIVVASLKGKRCVMLFSLYILVEINT